MDRREAISLLGMSLLGGCGGGAGVGGAAAGGGNALPVAEVLPAESPPGAPATPPESPAGTAASPSPVTAPLSKDIAAWGDSLTDLYVRHLAQIYPDRQVFNAGVVGQTSQQIAARLRADTGHRSWVSVLWYGHNNFRKDEVKADIAASIATLAPNQCYVILSMLNWAPTGARGTQEYADVVRVNGELAALYPQNFLDIRQHLVGLFNPGSPQDVQDHQNDLPPSSLRFDGIHLNDAGCRAVARKLQEFLASRGW